MKKERTDIEYRKKSSFYENTSKLTEILAGFCTYEFLHFLDFYSIHFLKEIIFGRKGRMDAIKYPDMGGEGNITNKERIWIYMEDRGSPRSRIYDYHELEHIRISTHTRTYDVIIIL